MDEYGHDLVLTVGLWPSYPPKNSVSMSAVVATVNDKRISKQTKHDNELFIGRKTKQVSDALAATQRSSGHPTRQVASWQRVFWNRVQFPCGVRRQTRKVAQIWADVVTTATTTTKDIYWTDTSSRCQRRPSPRARQADTRRPASEDMIED